MRVQKKSWISLVWAVLLGLVACSQQGTQVPLDAFVAPGGQVEVGEEQLTHQNCWWFSVEAAPAFLYSGRYVNGFKTRLEGERILVTAQLQPIPRHSEFSAARFASVCALRKGRYPVAYRDPNGVTHDLGIIELFM